MRYDIQHIDKYLDDELSEPEVNAFEEEMQTNEDFAHEVKLQQTARETVEYANFMDKIETIRSEKSSSEQSVKPSGSIIRRLLPVVGLVAAALIVLLIWQPWQRSFYQPYELNITQLSSSNSSLQQAQNTYNSGDYTAAIPLLEKFPDTIPAQIAKANAHYELGEFDQAVASLKPIASGNSGYKTTANWYLALTYLKQDQSEKARTALKEIKAGEYYDRAQRLLNKIK